MKAIGAFTIFLLLCESTFANDFGYATSVDGNLWLIDFTDITATSIGNTGELIIGLAQRSDGVLFGTDDIGRLFTISTNDATATLVGDTTLGAIQGLDFNGDVLMAVCYATLCPVYTLNQSTAAPTLVATPTQSIGSVYAAVSLDSESILTRGDSLAPRLVDINLNDGSVSHILYSDTYLNIQGMDFIGDKLYGNDRRGNLYNVDPVSGIPTLIGKTGSQDFQSLTEVVPEPSTCTLTLAMLSLLALAYRPRQRYQTP